MLYVYVHLLPQAASSLKGHSNLKLISIPLVFIFLRMWTTLVNIVFIHGDADATVPLALQYLSVSMH